LRLQTKESALKKKTSKFKCPATESALISHAKNIPAKRIWTTTVGRGQLARTLATERPDAEVTCLSLDAYLAERVLAEASGEVPAGLRVYCQSDWPESTCDLVLLPVDENGEEELARDLMQSAYLKLEIGGKLLLSAPHRWEGWAREQLKPYDKRIKATRIGDAVVCEVEKNSELKRPREFSAEVAFRDREKLIQLRTRPGVFAHRKLDLGARQLLNTIEVDESTKRILDLGCGSGSVGLGLAMRGEGIQVIAVDSNPRALECTRNSFAANGLGNLQTILNHDAQLVLDQPVDLAVANPPYFSHFKIAEIFCEIASRNLRQGGQVFFVAKNVEWYLENFGRWFSQAEIIESGGYRVITGVR
jgi:16S rRNA G1207 methylase RsmC